MMFGNTKLNYWICQLMGWGATILAMLIYAWQNSPANINRNFFLRGLLIIFCGIVSTHILRYFIIRKKLIRLDIRINIFNLLISIPIVSIGCALLFLSLVTIFNINNTNALKISFLSRYVATTITFMFYIVPWVLFYFIYSYIQINRQRELNALKLESQIKDLEIRMIQSKVNPSFLFNALDSISNQVKKSPDKARHSITDLSNILRFSIQSAHNEIVPLEKELDMLENYINIENVRFDDSLKLSSSIDDDSYDKLVPALFLVRMAEFGIQHYQLKTKSPMHMELFAHTEKDALLLFISLSGLEPPETERTASFQQEYTDQLKNLFGANVSFTINQVHGQLIEFAISIPVTATKGQVAI